ncbi:ribosomal RNA small subunit methyltransferase A [Candidatus Parcubacteria bacterium]|nr:MAG: ribosomal RNA small subunit methyltransferase A [Candidatus Parcubacteria bacterium]
MGRKGARLGQHFLIHSWAARKLAHAASPRDGEVIVEIGPGKGVLTKELLALAPVIAVEKDGQLVEKLRETFANEIKSGRLTLIEDDVRNFDPTNYKLQANSYIVAANIPYYITGEIIRQFLTTSVQPRAMALLVQKEVAQRVVDTKESILSISVKVYGTPKIIAKVGKSHFSPPPSVDSAILLIDDISKKFFSDISEESFFTLVRAGFASKRKMITNNLSALMKKEGVSKSFTTCAIPENARAENVSLDQWKCLALNAKSRASS